MPPFLSEPAIVASWGCPTKSTVDATVSPLLCDQGMKAASSQAICLRERGQEPAIAREGSTAGTSIRRGPKATLGGKGRGSPGPQHAAAADDEGRSTGSLRSWAMPDGGEGLGHDPFQALIVVLGPEETGKILHPLEVADGDAAGIGDHVGDDEDVALGEDGFRLGVVGPLAPSTMIRATMEKHCAC